MREPIFTSHFQIRSYQFVKRSIENNLADGSDELDKQRFERRRFNPFSPEDFDWSRDALLYRPKRNSN